MRLYTCGFVFVLLLATAKNEDQGKQNDYPVAESARHRRTEQYMLTLIASALIVKAILLPMTFKAMAVMTSVSVLLSLMSLIVSSIVTYAKLDRRKKPTEFKYTYIGERKENPKKPEEPNLSAVGYPDYGDQNLVHYGQYVYGK